MKMTQTKIKELRRIARKNAKISGDKYLCELNKLAQTQGLSSWSHLMSQNEREKKVIFIAEGDSLKNKSVLRPYLDQKKITVKNYSEFVDEMVSSILNQSYREFVKKLIEVETLVITNIHRVSDKIGTQKALVEICERRKQTILTSLAPRKSILSATDQEFCLDFKDLVRCSF